MTSQVNVHFSKVRDVKSPARGTLRSAGIDFFVPNDFKEVTVCPHGDALIPSGIRMSVPEGFMLMAADKSGVVTSKWACTAIGREPKKEAFASPVIVGAKIVDEDYQGEIHIHLINVGNEHIEIKPGMKIAQFILVPVLYAEPVEVEDSVLFCSDSERGAGAFGSTGSE